MTGLHACDTSLVMVLDSDDMIAPGALKVMVDAMAADEQLSVVWGDVERFGVSGYRLHRRGRTLDPWRITFVNELVASTLVRRSSVLAAGGWSLDDAYEDWDLWMAMAERGMKGRHVGRTTLLYRVDDPRIYQGALRRHGILVGLLSRRHEHLFAARSVNRRSADANVVLKVAWTVLGSRLIPKRVQRYVLFGALVVSEPSMRRRRRR